LLRCLPCFARRRQRATTYLVTFDNVLIDNNPNYTVTGSFLFDATKAMDPSAQPQYGLSNFNVLAVTPYGTFQANYMGADSNFDYLPLGSQNDTTPALILVFASANNDPSVNLLSEAALNGLPLSLITDGQSNIEPGRSVVVPSIAALYAINYSGFGAGNWPAASNAFPTISGDLIATAVPEPSTWAMLLIGFGGLGFMAYLRRRPSKAITA
jgi:hypothetical protein